MTGHDESGSSEKSPNDLPTFNAENMQNNMKAIHYSRTFMSIIGGVIAGILGFTGLTGFVFYFLVMAITSIGLIAKAGFTIHSYFDSWNQIIFDGILGGLMVHISTICQLLMYGSRNLLAWQIDFTHAWNSSSFLLLKTPVVFAQLIIM